MQTKTQIQIVEEEGFSTIALSDPDTSPTEEQAQKLQDHFHSLCIPLRVFFINNQGVKAMA